MTPGEEGKAVCLVATVCEDPSCMVCVGKRDATAVVTSGRDGNGGAKVDSRCSECNGSIHQWIRSSGFGDESEERENNSITHVCKHCNAVGVECYACCGEGEVDSGGTTPWGEWISVPCSECNCEGVILCGAKPS